MFATSGIIQWASVTFEYAEEQEGKNWCPSFKAMEAQGVDWWKRNPDFPKIKSS